MHLSAPRCWEMCPSPRGEAPWKHGAEVVETETSEGDNVKRGSASRSPGNTGSGGTDRPDAEILGAAGRASFGMPAQTAWRKAVPRGGACYRMGKTSVGEKLMGVTGMKQGRKGYGRSSRRKVEKAWALLSQGWNPGVGRCPLPQASEGKKTSKGASRKAAVSAVERDTRGQD